MRYSLLPSLLLALLPFTATAQSGSGDANAPAWIAAQGIGEVRVAPDRAVVRFGVQEQAPTAQKAQGAVNDVMAKVVAELKKLGVPANKISSDRINLYPVYAQQRPGEYDQEPRVVGFRASNTLRVELALGGKDPAVGKILDGAIGAGANSIEGVSFQLADDGPQRLKALRLASEDARTKAATIADALGGKLGKLREASEGGVSVGPIQPMMMKMDMARSAGTTVEPGEITVTASVSLRYELAEK